MAFAAQQLVGWWRARSTWGRVALVLLLLPLVPAVLIAARYGTTSGGKVAVGAAAAMGVLFYAAAGMTETTPAPPREPAAAEAEDKGEPARTPTPQATPSPTLDPAEALQDAVIASLGSLRSEVVTIDARPEASEVVLATRLPWAHDTDVDAAVAMCDAVLATKVRKVEVVATTGESLATSNRRGCDGPERLPLADLELLATSLRDGHEHVSGVEATSSRVVVTTSWTLAWDTPLDDAERLCDDAVAAAGDGWYVVVQDEDGRPLASGTAGCRSRASLPSPTPSPEPVAPPPPAPEPEPEPEPEPQPANDCHPSYQGACVPANVSDVDCAGGSGDGPAYTGRVNVVGPDVYGLDRDGDGVACE